MGAEISTAATAYDHGEFLRACLAEMTQKDFSLRSWRQGASRWLQVAVLDAKCGYDSLNSEVLPEDRRTAIDVTVLRESLADPVTNSKVRWVPGPEMLADGLTKLHGNGVLERVLRSGEWSLADTPEARALRTRANELKAMYRKRKQEKAAVVEK